MSYKLIKEKYYLITKSDPYYERNFYNWMRRFINFDSPVGDLVLDFLEDKKINSYSKKSDYIDAIGFTNQTVKKIFLKLWELFESEDF